MPLNHSNLEDNSADKKKTFARRAFGAGLLCGLLFEMNENRDAVRQASDAVLNSIPPVPSNRHKEVQRSEWPRPNTSGIVWKYDVGSVKGNFIEKETVRKMVKCVLDKAEEDDEDVVCGLGSGDLGTTCRVVENGLPTSLGVRMLVNKTDSSALELSLMTDIGAQIYYEDQLRLNPNGESGDLFKVFEYPISEEDHLPVVDPDDEEEMCESYYEAVVSSMNTGEFYPQAKTVEEFRAFALNQAEDPEDIAWINGLSNERLEKVLNDWHDGEDFFLKSVDEEIDHAEALNQLDDDLYSSGLSMDLSGSENEGRVGEEAPVYITPITTRDGEWIYEGSDPSGNTMCWGDADQMASCLKLFDF